MEANSDKKFHSLPNVRTVESADLDRKMYSLSLSQIRKSSEFKNYRYKPSPFHIRWINGYNPKVDVINLNTNGSTTVFYAASNCAVLFNWTTNQMKILQGHKNMVTCLSSDVSGRWLVTADSGPENILTIWDSIDCFPQMTLFSPHGNVKISKIAISADAKYLLSLGYHEKLRIYWWIWSLGKDQPQASIDVDISRDGVIAVDFNPENSKQFILLTKHDIWIGTSAKIFVTERGQLRETDDYELKIRKPARSYNDANCKLTSYTFVKSTCQVLVATNRGTLMVYGYTISYHEKANCTNYEDLRFIKELKIDKSRINVIKSVDGIVITGNKSGKIHFYDEQMKLLYWMDGLHVDSVKGLSFNLTPRSYEILDPKCNKKCPCWESVVSEVDPKSGAVKQKLIKKKLPVDATTRGKAFLVRDFLVGTNNQGIGFVDFVTEKLHPVLDYKVSPALTLSAHPEKPLVSIGYMDGIVELFNFIQHKLFARIDLRDIFKVVIPPKEDSVHGDYEITLPKISVTALKYSPSGLHLACGLNNGELLFLHPTTVDVKTSRPFKDSSYAIKDITYSCDSLMMAVTDAGRTVIVYKYDCVKLSWSLVGKHRSHYKDISSIFFSNRMNDNGEYKLLSVGTDRIMVEYDIGESFDESLEILSLDRIEQSAVPLAAILWPTPKEINPEDHRTDQPLILIANDEHKFKILNYDTTMTLSTVLGPRYEHPVCKMQLIFNATDGEYLLFATKNVIGLQKMPLDGNPWKHVGIVGHPIEIVDWSFREDIGTLFTIGAHDSCTIQWAANYRSVETTTRSGGEDLDPYYCLVEDGRPGWLFTEIRDLFYYIQILCQGTFSPAMRRVKDFIPIDSLPDMMRALGFYPSEYEVENLLAEAKYKVYQLQPSAEIDFEEFVKLYLNHRPPFGDSFLKIRNAFRTFATFRNETYIMQRDDFVDMLSNFGENFPEELSWYLLSILYGHSSEERAALKEKDFSFMPEEISFGELVNNIMGIQDNDNLSEQHSILESMGSQLTGSSI